MKFRAKILVAVLMLSWIVLATPVFADDVTLTGTLSFGALDGSAQDHDGAVNGIFTVNDGDLVISGIVQCNDDLPLPQNAGACPIAFNVSGDLIVEAGSAIFAENRRGGGKGGNISLTVGGDLILRGPSGALSGAVVSSSRTTDNAAAAGNITFTVQGNLELEAGSTVAASTPNGTSGTVEMTADGPVVLAGLVASGPSRQVLGTKLTGKVLNGGSSNQVGGAIVIRSGSPAPGIRVEGAGIIASQGENPGSQLILLEGCGLEIRGLVASVLKRDGPSQVVLRSGESLLIDGRDLGSPTPNPGRLGRVRADGSEGGSAGYMVDLFTQGDIQVLGPNPASSLFAVSSSPGTQAQRSGGTITSISLAGALTATGNAFEAGRSSSGNQGGSIDLKAKGDVTLDGATLKAVGGFNSTSPSRKGGQISVRSFAGALSWTFGVGDVRPVGSGVPASRQGAIALTACTNIDTTGTQFPTVGSAILPFPVENEGVCSPTAPSLPNGEPPLPSCIFNEAPVADDDAYSVDEGEELNVAAPGVLDGDTDADGDPLTAVLASGPAHASSFTLNPDGSFSYEHDGSETATDSFTYKANDGTTDSNVATVTITIDPVNDVPEADDDAYNVNEGGTLNVAAPGVLDGDTDGDGDSLSAVLVSGPAQASSFALNADGSFSYTHNGSETTSDSFTYKANDGTADSNVATVTITIDPVNDVPVADDDAYNVDEGGTLNVSAPGVLDGDTDGDGDSLSAVLVSGPMHASSFALNTNGSFSYTHNGSETTTDLFTYKANDGTADSNVATVTITVNPVDDPPTAVNDSATVDEDSGANPIDVLANDTDADGGSKLVQSVTQPENGAVAITGGGAGLSYTPDPNYCNNPPGTAPDTFTYTLSPGGSIANVSVLVNCFNDAPVADPDAFDFIGNTDLVVDLEALETPHARETTPTTFGVVDGDSDPEGDAFSVTSITVGICTDSSAPLDCSDPAVGRVQMQPNGQFIFTPAPGDSGAAETFQYTLTDNGVPAPASAIGTVTLTRFERVWYVNNDAPADGNGTSSSPFNSITAANLSDNDSDGDLTDDLDSAGDYIFVYFGDGTTNNQAGGLVLENGQHLIGEHAGLSLNVNLNGNGAPTDLVDSAPGSHPLLDDNVVDAFEGVSARNVIPAEIVGMNLAGNVNAVDWTTTAAFSGTGTFTIRDNVIRSAAGDGVDMNLAGTSAVNLAFHDNDLTATGTALDIQETGTGSLTITAFDGNDVSENTGGSGIIISNAIFDAVPGGGLDTVNADTLEIGVSGNGVGGAGMALGNVQGDLHFSTNLNIFADGGAGLTVTGTGAGMQLRVSSGGSPTGIVEATGGPAVDATATAFDLRLTSLKSSNSASTGVSLTNVTGTFSAEAGSITNSTGTDFAISGGTAAIIYKGTITDDVGQLVSVAGATAGTKSFEGAITDGDDGDGGGISLSGNTGATVRFAGGLILSTGGNAAFAATGGGTVVVCDENPCNGSATGALVNKITTATATALNVANTTIGASNLEFRSISSNGGANSGIVLNATGAVGGLKVKGTGGAGTGGTIQNKTVDGISLINTRGVSLSSMVIDNNDGSGIFGDDVTDFSLISSSVTNNADTASGTEAGLRFNELLGNCAITNSTVSGSSEDEIRITPASGVLNNLAISGTTIGPNNAVTGGNGITLAPTVSADVTMTVTGGVFKNIRSSALLANGNDNTRRNITVSGATFRDSNSGVHLLGSFNGDLEFEITGNTFLRHGLNPIQIVIGTTSTNAMQVVGTISGNVIGDGTPDSGARDLNGIAVEINGDADSILSITNNTVSNTDIDGIFVQTRLDDDADAQTGRLDLTLRDNTVNTPDDNSAFPFGSSYGTRVESRNTTTICLDIAGNSSASVGGLERFRTRQRDTSTFIMERLTDGDGTPGELITNMATVEAFLVGQNDAGSTADATQQTAASGYTEAANGFCRKP